MVACDPGTTYDSEFMDEEQEVSGVGSARSFGDDPFAPDERDTGESGECTKMDLVFVIDDSGSMREEQENLARNFPQFVSALEAFRTQGGAKLDWRAAVTTTSTGSLGSSNGGRFVQKAACNTSRPWVESADSNATSAFACLPRSERAGAAGAAARALGLALTDRVADGTNAGFLREDALLGAVVLTDEDDSSRNSTGKPSPLGVQAVPGHGGAGSGRWAASVIAGEQNCSSSFGSAIEATRLKSFVSDAGKYGRFSSICEGDLTKGLREALSTFEAACKSFPPPVK